MRGMGGSKWASTPSIPVTAGQGRGRGVVHPSAMTPAPATPPTTATGNGLGGMARSVHAINVAPPVVQDVQNLVGDDTQSPTSTLEADITHAPEEAEVSPVPEIKASLVYEPDFNPHSAAVELPTPEEANHQDIKQQQSVQQAVRPQPPSGDAGPRTLSAMASFGETSSASLERMAATSQAKSSRGGHRGYHRGNRGDPASTLSRPSKLRVFDVVSKEDAEEDRLAWEAQAAAAQEKERHGRLWYWIEHEREFREKKPPMSEADRKWVNEQIGIWNIERIEAQAAARKEAARRPVASNPTEEPAQEEAVPKVEEKAVEREPEHQPTEDDLLTLGLGEFFLKNKDKGEKRDDDQPVNGDLGLLD